MALASTLKLGSIERILVVPGNHDVDWSSNLTQLQRFNNYMQATEGFSSPSVTNDKLQPKLYDLSGIREGISVEVFLMVSPTFSGIPDPTNDSFIARIEKILADVDPDQLSKITGILKKARGLLDIAAIGAHQLRELKRSYSRTDETIRIAVLHHHLLPDPQIEVSQFEAVLDAGKVLDELIDNQVDLVLSGHKHNRRLVNYETDDKAIHVYTAPRLFRGSDGANPGFTMIDIYGANNPDYALLNYYDTATFRQIARAPLVRKGRILHSVTRICAGISQENQQQAVVPTLESLKAALEWREEISDKAMFGIAWDQVLRDLKSIGEKSLTFRPPDLWEQWNRLIESVGEDAEIQVVSDGDLGYWKQASIEFSEAHKYASSLAQFRGKKTRILILHLPGLTQEEQKSTAIEVVQSMIDGDFRVIIVRKSDIPNRHPQIWTDFGIMGSRAVSFFLGMEGPSRSLTESFNPSDMHKAKEDWRSLIASRSWDSAESHVTFAVWLDSATSRT